MRANEFIIEYKEYQGINLDMNVHNHQLIVRALDDWGNNELGHVVFNIGDSNELDPQELEVDERYRGQGIAKVMYDYVKSNGYKIVRSWDQTDAGAGFWNKHRGEDVRVWEGKLSHVLYHGSPLTELFKPGKKWQWSFTGSEEAVAVFHVGDIPYQFIAYTWPGADGAWEVEFKNANRKLSRSVKFGLTGTGNSAEVMSTIADIMREFIQKYKEVVTSIVFSAEEESRKSLYARMAKRLLPDWRLGHDDKMYWLKAPREEVN